MKSIKNTTRSPLAVPLPRGKKLRLGPGKIGEIADGAAKHPPLLKMVKAEQLEILDSGASSIGHAADGGKVHGSSSGHTTGAQAYRSGDR